MPIPNELLCSDRSEASSRTWKVRGLIGLLAITGAPGAHADETTATVEQANSQSAASGSQQDSSELQEVVVTGTSIRRSDTAALPVTVLGPEQMGLRDANTPADLLTALPAVVNVPINDSTQGGAGARGDIAAVNLRGLGSGNTLVLLNGRRVASHGISAQEGGVPELSVNVNVLPTVGLSRVDVLRDGASSLYGSDAVAGVINFVTDNKYVGNQVQLQAQMTEIASGSSGGFSLLHGNDALGGNLHWTSDFNLYWKQAIKSSDLPNATDSNKVALAPPGFNAANGPFFDRSASGAYPSFLIGSSKTVNYLVPVAGGGAAIQTTAPARTGAQLGAYYDVNSTGYAEPQTKRINWFNALDYKLNDSLSLFGELALYRAESVQERPAVAYGINTDVPLVVPANNPWNPYGTSFYDPAGAPTASGSPRLVGTPQAVTINATRLVNDGPERIEINSDFARALAGARGKLGGTWTFESALMYSIDHVTDTSQNAIRESALAAATRLTDATAFNPFNYTFQIVGGKVVPNQPYTNTEAQMSSFVQKLHQQGRDILASWDGHVNGELFDLPGGPVQLASGMEFRYENYALTRPQYAGLNYANPLGLDPNNNDFVQASAAGNVIGSRTVGAAFAETVIPVFSAANALPMLAKLDFGAAVRYEHYSDFGGTTNPKFTFDWRPVQAVMFRGSYNHGFRAPNLAVLNYPSRSTVGTAYDPYRGPVTNQPGDGQAQRLTTIVGNHNLQPEKSEGGTLGVVFDVPYVDGLSLSADFWKIHQTNLIAAPNVSQLGQDDAARLLAATQAALAAGIPLAQIDLGSGTGGYAGNPLITRSSVITAADRAAFAAYNAGRPQSQWLAPVGVLLATSTPYTNLASATIDGVDLNMTYRSPRFSWGRFQLITDATWLDKYQRRASASAPIEHRVGLEGATRWRGSMNLIWSKDDIWGAGVSAYYVGSYADVNATITPAAAAALGNPSYIYRIDGVNYFRIKSSITTNAFASYKFTREGSFIDQTTLRLGVINLANEAPPLSSDPAGYDPTVYQSMAAGRTWSLRVTKDF
ncbi:MAG: btuB 3 [Gammaproteobacteria bacterium]|nr:btuB 3 [Gammaproteobacteria bacterium]